MPVARVFVLGPGSGRTAALAVPILAFAPAVVGFAMLGLASRTLLAQHEGRAAGLTTATGWAVVILGVLAARPLVPPEWLVPAAAASVSLGMIVGAVVGWLLVGLSHRGAAALGLTRPMLAAAGSAVVAAALCAVIGQYLDEVGLVTATLGAFGLAAGCGLIFVAMLRLTAPRLLAQIWSLRRSPAVESRS